MLENRHMSTTTWMQHNCAKYFSKKQSTSYLKYYSDISQRSVAVAIAKNRNIPAAPQGSRIQVLLCSLQPLTSRGCWSSLSTPNSWHLKAFQVWSKRKNNVSLFMPPSVRLLLSLRPTLTTEAAVTPRSSSPRRTKPRPSCRPAASPTATARVSLPLVSQPTAARFHTQVGFWELGPRASYEI